MKSNRFLKILVGLILPLLFASCQDHIVPPSAKHYRISGTFTYGVSLLEFFYGINFSYDASNRLIRYSYSGKGVNSAMSFTYDAQGRLASSYYEEFDTGPNATPIPGTDRKHERYLFQYDTSNRLIEKRSFYDGLDNNKVYAEGPKTLYEYGTGQMPTKITIDGGSYRFVTQYTYSNENIIKKEDFGFFSDGTSTGPTTTTYEYDNSFNPFYGLVLPGDPTAGIDTYSKNSVIDKKLPIHLVGSDGRLIQALSADLPPTNHQNYTYEEY